MVQCKRLPPGGGLDTKRRSSLGSGTEHLKKEQKNTQKRIQICTCFFFMSMNKRPSNHFELKSRGNAFYRIVLAKRAATEALNRGGNGSC